MMANQKSDLVELFADVCSSIHRLYNQEIQEIRSDFPQNLQGTGIPSFCKSQGIKNNFVKSYRKPLLITKSILKTVHEMANLMLVEKDLQMEFWADAVQTACHLINRVYLKPFTTMTPAEIWYDRKPNLHYLRVFGSKCRIPETTDDEGIFIGYSAKGKTYRIFNPKTKEVIESAKIDVDKVCELSTSSPVKRSLVSTYMKEFIRKELEDINQETTSEISTKQSESEQMDIQQEVTSHMITESVGSKNLESSTDTASST